MSLQHDHLCADTEAAVVAVVVVVAVEIEADLCQLLIHSHKPVATEDNDGRKIMINAVIVFIQLL